MPHRAFCDPAQRGLVIRKPATFEVVHDQKHIESVLKRAQVHGVGEIVADVEAHPMIEIAHQRESDMSGGDQRVGELVDQVRDAHGIGGVSA